MLKNKKAKIVLLFIGFFGVLIALWILTNGSNGVSAFGGDCTIPENSAYLPVPRGIYQVYGMDLEVYVSDGVVQGGAQLLTNDLDLKVPRCYSKELGLITMVNLQLIDENGNPFLLIIGKVGNSEVLGIQGSEIPLQ